MRCLPYRKSQQCHRRHSQLNSSLVSCAVLISVRQYLALSRAQLGLVSVFEELSKSLFFHVYLLYFFGVVVALGELGLEYQGYVVSLAAAHGCAQADRPVLISSAGAVPAALPLAVDVGVVGACVLCSHVVEF
jgi:hypothetical protein